jgi:gliding motility-associated lipoprotein GldH
MQRIIYLIPLFLLLALNSCDDAVFYEENRDITDGSWKQKQRISFDFEIPDTNTHYNFYFNVRNTDEYLFRNLYVFMHTKFPNERMGHDTIEFPLADERGHWYGKGQGDIHDCRLIFKKNVRFPVAGKYHMEIEQGMRSEELPGLIDAGIRIERVQ